MKRISIVTAALLFCLLLFQCSASSADPSTSQGSNYVAEEAKLPDFDSTRLTVELPKQITQLKQFICTQNGKYSPNIAVFIDMRILSNRYRFFVVDLKNNSILDRGLVSHGSGSETDDPDSLQFNNIPNPI
jgi:hypothetical protein